MLLMLVLMLMRMLMMSGADADADDDDDDDDDSDDSDHDSDDSDDDDDDEIAEILANPRSAGNLAPRQDQCHISQNSLSYLVALSAPQRRNHIQQITPSGIYCIAPWKLDRNQAFSSQSNYKITQRPACCPCLTLA